MDDGKVKVTYVVKENPDGTITLEKVIISLDEIFTVVDAEITVWFVKGFGKRPNLASYEDVEEWERAMGREITKLDFVPYRPKVEVYRWFNFVERYLGAQPFEVVTKIKPSVFFDIRCVRLIYRMVVRRDLMGEIRKEMEELRDEILERRYELERILREVYHGTLEVTRAEVTVSESKLSDRWTVEEVDTNFVFSDWGVVKRCMNVSSLLLILSVNVPDKLEGLDPYIQFILERSDDVVFDVQKSS